MPTTYGSAIALTASPQRSFTNISTSTVTFVAAGITYTLNVNGNVTIPSLAAQSSTSIETLLSSGSLKELTVFGAMPSSSVIVPTSSTPSSATAISFTAATQSSITGSFDGIGIDTSSGHWILSDGNRLIYPNSRSRKQPPPGLNSVITMAATMQRLGLSGSFGFAIYTDAKLTDHTFRNGLDISFESSGLCQIYRYESGLVNNLVTISTQQRFPIDYNEHTYSVVIQQIQSDTLNIYAYVDGIVCSQSIIKTDIITNGTVGFSTLNGCSPILIVPNSFEFTLGTNTHETSSTTTQEIISNINGNATLNIPSSGSVTGQLPLGANTSQVLIGAVTGSVKNLVPDSDFKFGSSLWNINNAGSLAVLLGVGAAGGKGIVYQNTTTTIQNTGSLQYTSSAVLVTPGSQLTLSGNILASSTTTGGTGLPTWEIWTWNGSGVGNKIAKAEQSIGSPTTPSSSLRRVQDTFFIPLGITQIVCIAATNNVAVSPNGSIIWSEPMLQDGPYETAYVSNIIGDQGNTLPLVTSPIEVTSVIVPNGIGGGAVLLGQAAPNSYAPYIVMPSQITSVVSPTQGVSTTYLSNQTVASGSILPGAVTQNAAAIVTYTNNHIANIFNNIANNYYWYLVGYGGINGSNTILDGSTIIYSVSTVDPSASPRPLGDPLTIDANSTATVVWNHPAFIGTSIGSTSINFTGNAANTTSVISSVAQIADLSTPNVTSIQSTQTTYPQQTTPFINTGSPSITSILVPQTKAIPVSGALQDSASPNVYYSTNAYTVASLTSINTGLTPSNPSITSYNQPLNTLTSQSQAISLSSSPAITSNTVTILAPVLETSTSGTLNQGVTNTTTSTPYNYNTAGTSSNTYAQTGSITSSTTNVIQNQLVNPGAQYYSANAGVTTTPTTTQVSTPWGPVYSNGGSASVATITPVSTSPVGNTAAQNGVRLNAPTCTTTAVYQNLAYGGYWVYTDSGGGLGPTFTMAVGNSFPVSAGAPVTFNANFTYYGDRTLESTKLILTIHDGTNQLTYVQGLQITGGTVNLTFNAGAVGVWHAFIYAISTPEGKANSVSGTTTPYVIMNYNFNGYYSHTNYGDTEGSNIYLQNMYVDVGNTPVVFDCSAIANSADGNGGATPQLMFVTSTQGTIWGPADAVAGGHYVINSTIAQIYAWYYRSRIYADNQTGTGRYAANIDGNSTCYHYVPNTTYSSTVYNGVTINQYTSAQCVSPSAANPIIITATNLNCPGDGNSQSYMAVYLIGPDGHIYFGQNYGSTASYSTVYTGGGPAGTWTLQYTAVCYGFNGQPTTSSAYDVVGMMGMTYYQAVSVPQTTYYPNDSTAVGYWTPSVLAPTSIATQISCNLANTSCPSNAYGNIWLNVQLWGPAGMVPFSDLQYSTDGVNWNTSGGQYSLPYAYIVRYSKAIAVGGVYEWYIWGHVNSANNGTSTYAISSNPILGWYTNSTGITIGHAGSKSPITSFYTSTSTLAPSGSSLQIACNFTSVSCPSDANGTTEITVSLYDPNNTFLSTQDLIGSNGGTTASFIYSSGTAIAGQYRFDVIAKGIASSTSTTNSTYQVMANVSTSYYEIHNVPVTTYTAVPGITKTYSTTSATLAPLSISTALTLNMITLAAYADSVGYSAFNITLTAPDGSNVGAWQKVTIQQTLTYIDSNALSGIFIWTISAYCTSNNKGISTYNDSITGSIGWYENVTSNVIVYVDKPGATNSFTTNSSTLAPTSVATELSLNITELVATSDTYGSTSWVIKLTSPNLVLAKTWNITNTQTLVYFDIAAIAGIWTWTINSVCTDTATGTQRYVNSITATLNWYVDVVISTPGYDVTPGKPGGFSTLSAAAPTSNLTQISFIPTIVTLSRDIGGYTEYSLTLQDPSGSVVGTWIVDSSLTPITWFNASAITGIYTFSYYATVVLSNTPINSTYPTVLSATVGWYILNTANVVKYVNNASNQISSGATDPNTLAPTLPSSALTLSINTVTLPKTANGSTLYIATLRNPTGANVLTQNIIDTTPIVYYNSAATSGSYTWNIYSTCTNTGIAIDTFTTQFSGSLIWYIASTKNVTLYTDHDGIASTYLTAANTAAPVSIARELSLSLQTVNTAPTSFGTSSIAVMLSNPNGNLLLPATKLNITGPTTITYYDPGAIAGTYTWSVFGQCQYNNNGTGSFTTSWTGNYNWYQPSASSKAVYILAADGITQRQSISDDSIYFNSISPSQAVFSITNSSNTPLGFTLGIMSKGF